MPGWTLESNGDESTSRVFSRLLGLVEEAFYWDTQVDGTGDVLPYATVIVSDGKDILSAEAIKQTWVLMKQRFPLLGAKVQETRDEETGTIDVRFRVEEASLSQSRDREVNIGVFHSQLEEDEFRATFFDGPRHLSNDLLGQVYCFGRTDIPDQYHIYLHFSHLITDGLANNSFTRAFLQALATKSWSAAQPAWDLEERLWLARCTEDRSPSLRLSLPRQRWRRAIASVMYHRSIAKMKGGQALPRRLTTATLYTPGLPRTLHHHFSVEDSAEIISTCRKSRITFGHAFPVAVQVAHSRVIQRLYQQGRISEDEWTYRRMQPMYNGGPLSMLPYLDKTWLKRGGAEHLCLSVNFFDLTLPFMPVGNGVNFSGVGPSYVSPLSPERFLLRCNIVKTQMLRISKDPLFLERAEARGRHRVDQNRDVAFKWRAAQNTGPQEALANAAPVPIDGPPFTYYNEGSSMGNLDAILPFEYPIPKSHPMSPRSSTRAETVVQSPQSPIAPGSLKQDDALSTLPISKVAGAPVIKVLSTHGFLHCRPAEFYLAATASQNEIHMAIFYDGNVYEDDLVGQWMNEVVKAIEWHLVRPGKHASKL